MPLTGIQMDAIYHTSLAFGGVEYFFGQGIHRTVPGTTHHGQPMEKLRMGRTELPMEVILEYLESLAEIYTPEVNEIFNDFIVFVVGPADPD
jgi:hypothetical protein